VALAALVRWFITVVVLDRRLFYLLLAALLAALYQLLQAKLPDFLVGEDAELWSFVGFTHKPFSLFEENVRGE
jgi:hypothetical protein